MASEWRLTEIEIASQLKLSGRAWCAAIGYRYTRRRFPPLLKGRSGGFFTAGLDRLGEVKPAMALLVPETFDRRHGSPCPVRLNFFNSQRSSFPNAAKIHS